MLEKVTVLSIQNKKSLRKPITALTCYDAYTGNLVDQGGIDIALVGDSLANTRLGYSNTIPITMNEMLHHVRASARGVHRALLVADMPFHSYEAAPWEAAKHAGQFIKTARAQAVKLEGGIRVGPSIRAILKANIPVMGHLGLTPQSIHQTGGYRVQGKTPLHANRLLKEALYLQKLGVFSIVLEGIPALLGKKISKRLKIPTIGIGAGPYCDGQILVLDDILGMNSGPDPKFVKRFAHLRPLITQAISKYRREVISRKFPSKNHSY